MQMTKKVICLLIIFVLLFISLAPISYATTKITKEDLEKFFDENLKEEAKDDVIITDSAIEINITEEGSTTPTKYIINYDLGGDNPIFSIDLSFNSTMTSKEITDELEKIVLLSYGFMPVANIVGNIPASDSAMYFLLLFLNGDFKNATSMTSLDDVKSAYYDNYTYTDECFTITFNEIKDSTIENVIDENIIADNSDEYNLKVTLTIDTEKDFSKITKTINEMEDAIWGKAEEAWKDSLAAMEKEKEMLDSLKDFTNSVNTISNTSSENATSNAEKIPQAGGNTIVSILFGIIVLSSIGIIGFRIYEKNLSK